MTLDEFDAFSLARQIAVVLIRGTFLATRWDGNCMVNLHHLPGEVFAELHFDTQANEMVHCRTFTGRDLRPYTDLVQLPIEWLV